MRITIIAGARPNFMKIAPIIHSLNKTEEDKGFLKFNLVHTGQHYDKKMSENFFNELRIPKPDINLNCGGGSQAEQTAGIMIAFEEYLINNPTDLVIVVGDVNSTMACSIVAKKLNVKVAHIEAGIRSFDLTMPEEINRLITDSIADYFFTTSVWANENLIRTGIPEDKIFFVGNVMIDTLLQNKNRFKKPNFWEEYGLKKKNYIVLTLHRPANVDDPVKLHMLMQEILSNSKNCFVVFPMHPRTAKKFEELNFSNTNLKIVEPLGYLEFNYLVENSIAVITDSGGITEETTVLGVPCLTLRDNTERPETVEVGTNELIGTDPNNIKPALEKLLQNKWKKGSIPDLWDGNSADRIVNHLLQIFRE